MLKKMFPLYLLVFIAWLILNEKVTLEIIIVGVLLILLVSIVHHLLVPPQHRHGFPFRKMPQTFAYLWLLLVEVIKSNIEMIKIVLFVKEEELTPTITRVKSGLKTNIGITALTSSITLTPGTITVAAYQDELYIHALDESMLDGIDDSIFIHKLKELES